MLMVLLNSPGKTRDCCTLDKNYVGTSRAGKVVEKLQMIFRAQGGIPAELTKVFLRCVKRLLG